MFKTSRIIVPLLFLITLSGCFGGLFDRPDYAVLVIDAIEPTSNGIRIAVHNLGAHKAHVTSMTLYAENSAGDLLAPPSAPDSGMEDGTWFTNVEIVEDPLGNPQHFILPDSIAEGWAFSGVTGITRLRVEMEWISSHMKGEYERTFYTLPYYRTGEDIEGEDI